MIGSFVNVVYIQHVLYPISQARYRGFCGQRGWWLELGRRPKYV